MEPADARGRTTSLVDVEISGARNSNSGRRSPMAEGPRQQGSPAGAAPPAVVAGSYNSTRDVLVLGVAFWLLFTAFQTSSFFQAPILEELGFGDELAFAALALLYAAFSTSLFVVPRLIDRFGARRTIFIGSSTYVIFICTLIHVISPVFLAASAVNGVGGALLWTSQGNLLTRYSSEKERNRNSAVFNSFLQSSLFTGALAAYILVPPGSDVSVQTAQHLYLVLFVVGALGCITLLALNEPPPVRSAPAAATLPESGVATNPMTESLTSSAPAAAQEETLCQSIVGTFRMGCRRRVAMVNLLLIYNGLGLSFYQGKYPEIVAGKDPLAPELPAEFEPRVISFVMVATGVAEIIGGLFCDRFANRWGSSRVLWVGLSVQIISFATIYVNLLSGLVTPNLYVAFGCAAAMGFGDATVVILAYSMFGRLFKGGNSKVFALMFFSKSAAAGVAFGYSHSFPLVPLVAMLACIAVPAGISFTVIDKETLHLAATSEVPPAGGRSGNEWTKLSDDGPGTDGGGGVELGNVRAK